MIEFDAAAYSSVDLIGNSITIKKFVLDGSWTGDHPIFNNQRISLGNCPSFLRTKFKLKSMHKAPLFRGNSLRIYSGVRQRSEKSLSEPFARVNLKVWSLKPSVANTLKFIILLSSFHSSVIFLYIYFFVSVVVWGNWQRNPHVNSASLIGNETLFNGEPMPYVHRSSRQKAPFLKILDAWCHNLQSPQPSSVSIRDTTIERRITVVKSRPWQFKNRE